MQGSLASLADRTHQAVLAIRNRRRLLASSSDTKAGTAN
jgi:hypothetical protein